MHPHRLHLTHNDYNPAATVDAARQRLNVDEFFPDELPVYRFRTESGHLWVLTRPELLEYLVRQAAPNSENRVLVTGASGGYGAALLAQLTRTVYVAQPTYDLEVSCQRRWNAAHFANVVARRGDPERGWPEAAPFDLILLSSPLSTAELKRQLAIGGRLVGLFALSQGQSLVALKTTRLSADLFDCERLGEVQEAGTMGGGPNPPRRY